MDPATQPPTSTPPAAHADPERESDLSYALSVLAIIVGLLLIAASFVTMRLRQGEPGGLRWSLAMGAFLFVLGGMMRGQPILDRLRQRSSGQAAQALLSSFLVVFLAGFAIWTANQHNFWRADLTQEGVYTLGEDSRNLLARLDRDVRLRVVMTSFDRDNGEVLDGLLDQYATASSRLKVDKTDPTKLEKREVETLLRELDLGTDVRDRDQILGIVVQSGAWTADGWKKDKSKHVSKAELWQQDYDSPGGGKRTFMGEQRLSSAIREVVEGERPKLYLLEGHGEEGLGGHDGHEAQSGLDSLIKQLRQKNHEVVSLKLAQGEDVPEDCAVLGVIAPKRPLAPQEVASIQRYLDKGGDALFLLEPEFDRRAQATRFVPSGLEGLLEKSYQVVVEDRFVFCRLQDPFRPGRVVTIENIDCDEFDLAHKIVAPLAHGAGRVSFSGARPLRSIGSAPTHLVKTGQISPAVATTTDPLNGTQQGFPNEVRGGVTLAIASERDIAAPAPAAGAPAAKPKKSRVVVFGDVDFVLNKGINDQMYLNLELFMNSAAWAMEREASVVGKASRPRSYKLEMDTATLMLLSILSFVGFPALALCAGLFVYLMRRR